jgi:L-histidine N-alpha-methyltransferase
MTGAASSDTDRWIVVERPAPLTVHERLARDVATGLRQEPPWIPARWFYDEKGSLLFDDITTLEEYYPTRCEEEILAVHAGDVAQLTDASTLVELGAGTSAKTRQLLDALTAGGRSLLFVPLDVSVEILTDAARRIAADYPTVHVEALVADFEDPLAPLPGEPGRRLIAFLGGTIGNLNDGARAAFLARLREAMAPGDHFLLGVDLVKDPARLVAAYDDSSGVTAAFNRNLIDVLVRELHAEGLAADDFDHVARWNAERSQIEMWLRARRPIEAWFPELELSWSLPMGGELLTEISVKFQLPRLRTELAAAGLTAVVSWTDRADDFSVTLARAD